MQGSDGRSVSRVLHCFGAMDLGGAETFAMHAYRSVDRDRVQFDFAVSADSKSFYDEEIGTLGGRIIRHSPPMKAGFRRHALELARIIRQYGPFCAVHTHLHYFSGCILRIAAKEQIPVRIAHFHSNRDARSGTLLGVAYHAGMRWMIQRHATHILGCSRTALGRVFGERWPADRRMSVMHNSISLAPYSHLSHDRTGLCRKYSIPSTATILGHVGNFTPPKNHKLLIELFGRYLQREPNATLVLVGDGALRSGIEQQVSSSGLNSHVRFLGRQPQSQVPELLAAFDVLVMPSIYEGLPVTLVEAQSAGLRCVVSDAITSEADLGLGLLRFMNLQQPLDEWCDHISSAVKGQRPEWHRIRAAVQTAGYDITNTAADLTRMYQRAADLGSEPFSAGFDTMTNESRAVFNRWM
jgi:glycosyltransferase EpsF